MKQETKLWMGTSLINLAIFGIAWAVISWLVEGNGWLHLILAGLFASTVQDKIDIEEKINELRQQFNIADGQLIYVSHQVDRLVEKEDDWDEIASLKDRIEDLESNRD